MSRQLREIANKTAAGYFGLVTPNVCSLDARSFECAGLGFAARSGGAALRDVSLEGREAKAATDRRRTSECCGPWRVESVAV
jgi:hypothetical protein